jgi:antitoxin ParD1/3/4
MNLNLSPVDEMYVRQMIEAGYYSNATELIRDAVRRHREYNESKGTYNNPVYLAVLKAEEQYAKGQYRKYTPELFEEIQHNAEVKVRQAKQPKPDISPDEL